MHIPTAETTQIDILTFEEALKRTNSDYDTDKWLYVPDRYSEYRYILGTRGNNPLICIGINPSTAAPDALDNTLKSVSRIAAGNGFDSWIMFNVYSQRATRPDDMDKVLNRMLHEENMKAFRWVLSLCRGTPSIWAAWGAVIEKRDYLRQCVRDMAGIGVEYGAVWYQAGKPSVKGHPHHPLYLKKDSEVYPFDVTEYLGNI